MRPTVGKRMGKTEFSLKVSSNTQSFEKLNESIHGKKIHNCSEYRTTTTKTFTRICDSPGILWGQLSVLVHEPYKRRKKKALNQDKKETCSCRELSQCMYYNSQT